MQGTAPAARRTAPQGPSSASGAGPEGMRVEYSKISAVGDRQDNQDRAAVIVHEQAALMLVFDGMGGHSDGARAAETALKTVGDLFTAQRLPLFDPQGFLYSAMARAHDEVVALGSELAVDFRPRATCAVCLVQESGTWWCHVGDSRIYHMRNGRLVSRSRDHSHVEVLIQEGAITEREALDHPMRNFVECCLGGDRPVPDMSITRKKTLLPGDVLLACSDGLWTGISDEEMAKLATRTDQPIAENLKAISLKALGLNSPYSDNTTGVALRWLGASSP